MKTACHALSLLLLSVGLCRATEIFVPADYPTIQAAVDAAAPQDIVTVADGLYKGPGNRDILIEKDIIIRSAHGAKRCVIDCAANAKNPAGGFVLQGSDSLAAAERQVSIQGFTIRNGYAQRGGALGVNGRFNTQILDCHFINNSACGGKLDGTPVSILLHQLAGLGGSIYSLSPVTIVNCIFEGSRAQKGGAIYCGPGTTILHCTLTGNRADEGGAVFYEVHQDVLWQQRTSELVNSVFWDNRADFGGQLALGTGKTSRPIIDLPLPPSIVHPPIIGSEPVSLPPDLQGSIYYTGRDLDLAIDGPEFFVLDGPGDTVYTRIGNFVLDSEGYLIDPETGRYVRRWGTLGEDEGYQMPGDLRFRIIPPTSTIPAVPTTRIQFAGNLRASCNELDRTVSRIRLDCPFTVDANPYVQQQAFVTDLDQFSGTPSGNPGFIRVSGTNRAGLPVNADIVIAEQTCVQDILDSLTSTFNGSTATLDADGCIRLTDNEIGYSLTWIERFEYIPSAAGTDWLVMDGKFSFLSVGGQDASQVFVSIYDLTNGPRTLHGLFVKTTQPNTWDFVVMSLSANPGGAVEIIHPRISGLYFNVDGSFGGVRDPLGAWVGISDPDGAGLARRIELDFGTPGGFDGITQFASMSSLIFARTQDGSETGMVSSYAFDNAGVIVYTYTNGVKKPGGQIAAAAFDNPRLLAAADPDCYAAADSLSGPAQIGAPRGAIHGKSLETRSGQKKPIPLVVDRCLLQDGFKDVSFIDPQAAAAIEWKKTVFTSDPFFCCRGQWRTSRNGLFWKTGDYRPLPGSVCLDAAAPFIPVTADFAGRPRPFFFLEGNANIITFPLVERNRSDLGAFEVSWLQPPSTVRLSPEIITDAPSSVLSHKTLTVLICIDSKGSGIQSARSKDIRIFVQPQASKSLEAMRTYLLPVRGSDQLVLAAVFDLEEIKEVLETNALWRLSRFMEVSLPLDFWIIGDSEPWLKASSQVRCEAKSRLTLPSALLPKPLPVRAMSVPSAI